MLQPTNRIPPNHEIRYYHKLIVPEEASLRYNIDYMHVPFSVLIGKFVKKITQLRGGGSALPGLVMEKIDRKFVKRSLDQLPYGSVVISGTNGKTTTTKMVVELLEGQGLKVFTNRTGSNFVRGVASALLGEVSSRGKLTADIAVLELDEAHAVQFVDQVQPNYSLLLNVMRDQLDRFGEIDNTAEMLHKIAFATKEKVIINRDDPRLVKDRFLKDLRVPFVTYGVSPELQKQFPSDDNLHYKNDQTQNTVKQDDTNLDSIENDSATISYNSAQHRVKLALRGLYNIQNAVGAVALCRQILGKKLDEVKLFESLQQVSPAFGRGESIIVNGQPIELVLVKNPSGFRLGLQSFKPDGYATMIAINDQYADGRDMSWLWDVDFSSLSAEGVAIVSGVRAYDMALRLQYDEIKTKIVDTDLEKALDTIISNYPDQPKRIYCTYTAMLALRKSLSKITEVEVIR